MADESNKGLLKVIRSGGASSITMGQPPVNGTCLDIDIRVISEIKTYEIVAGYIQNIQALFRCMSEAADRYNEAQTRIEPESIQPEPKTLGDLIDRWLEIRSARDKFQGEGTRIEAQFRSLLCRFGPVLHKGVQYSAPPGGVIGQNRLPSCKSADDIPLTDTHPKPD